MRGEAVGGDQSGGGKKNDEQFLHRVQMRHAHTRLPIGADPRVVQWYVEDGIRRQPIGQPATKLPRERLV